MDSDDYESEPILSGVTTTPTAEDLRDLAVSLVESGQYPLDSILEQLRARNPSRRDVDIALGLMRLESFPFELAEPNAVWRVLVALKHGTEVQSLSEEDRRRIQVVEYFYQLDKNSAFAELVRLEPRLLVLEEKIRTTDNTRQSPNVNSDPLLEIERDVRRYVGPESEQDDIVLRSRLALNTALLHLWNASGLT
jgi:hypothetical protein